MIEILAWTGVGLTLALGAVLTIALFALVVWAIGGVFWAVMDWLP